MRNSLLLPDTCRRSNLCASAISRSRGESRVLCGYMAKADTAGWGNPVPIAVWSHAIAPLVGDLSSGSRRNPSTLPILIPSSLCDPVEKVDCEAPCLITQLAPADLSARLQRLSTMAYKVIHIGHRRLITTSCDSKATVFFLFQDSDNAKVAPSKLLFQAEVIAHHRI